MKFKHNWEFNTTEELNNIFTEGKKELNDLIVDTAIKNLKTKRVTIPVVSIYTKDEDMTFDVMIDRPDMVETLEQNLLTMEEYEDYERCQQIVKALDYLKLNS
jgi:hypothetical protein|tara:strand:- start:965 stop:1273 length:309 start_codon:yes stop_codon:yes gene_type:complete